VLVLPAVDIRGGKCVRLIQGDASRELVYSADPVEAALRWEACGAPWLHVVDLDGAFEGRPANLEVIRRLTAAVGVPVQVGGGIRSLAAVEQVLGAGAARVVLGTVAVTSPGLLREACRRFGERIAVALDGRRGSVVTEGWVRDSDRPGGGGGPQRRPRGRRPGSSTRTRPATARWAGPDCHVGPSWRRSGCP